MHDFHLADIIYKTIMDYAAKNNLKKVTKAVIELGSIVEHGEDIFAENREFNVKKLCQGNLAEGLAVEIKKVIGDSWVLKEIEGE